MSFCIISFTTSFHNSIYMLIMWLNITSCQQHLPSWEILFLIIPPPHTASLEFKMTKLKSDDYISSKTADRIKRTCGACRWCSERRTEVLIGTNSGCASDNEPLEAATFNFHLKQLVGQLSTSSTLQYWQKHCSLAPESFDAAAAPHPNLCVLTAATTCNKDNKNGCLTWLLFNYINWPDIVRELIE